jgi:signal transduction histidine kinase
MSTRPSIRARLAGALLAVSFAWGVAVTAVVWFTVQHEVDELLDNTLQEAAEILLGVLTLNAAQLPLQGGGAMPAPLHEEHLVWQIVDAGNQVLLRSHRAPHSPLATPQRQGFSNLEAQWRVFALRFDDQGRVLYVGQLGAERREASIEAARYTAGGALLVGLCCALLLRRLLRKELQPIVDMSQAVASFDPINPLDQLAEPQRAELMPMHAAITALGTRVARHIANERAFAAHAAHALRTPLAGMVTQLAAAQQRGNAEVQPCLARSREAATRLRQVVAALLTLFRSGTEVKPRPIDLQHLVNHLSISGLSLHIDASAALTADADLLAAALMNMLDNASRHGAHAVSISSLPAAAGQGIHIADDGPGIGAAHRQRLQAALDAQQYEGHMGLGLMLADLVCRAHGGRLVLCETSRGFAADLWLSARR